MNEVRGESHAGGERAREASCEATDFNDRRLKQLANERARLLEAYYAEAIDVAILKRKQARITTEQAHLEAQLEREGASLEETKEIIGSRCGWQRAAARAI